MLHVSFFHKMPPLSGRGRAYKVTEIASFLKVPTVDFVYFKSQSQK